MQKNPEGLFKRKNLWVVYAQLERDRQNIVEQDIQERGGSQISKASRVTLDELERTYAHMEY